MLKIDWLPSPNFRKGRNQKITFVVIHTMQGSFIGTKSWFQNYRAQVSAHYLVSKKGEICQMVKEQDTAWHVCNANPFTIGVELEDWRRGPDKNGNVITWTSQNDPGWFTVSEMDTAAELVADICDRYDIPLTNIIGHNDPLLKRFGNNHDDPGPFWPMEKFRTMVKSHMPTSTLVLGACA